MNFSARQQDAGTSSHSFIETQDAVRQRECKSIAFVSKVPQSEFLADLCQVADDEPCFFSRMGELARERMVAHG